MDLTTEQLGAHAATCTGLVQPSDPYAPVLCPLCVEFKKRAQAKFDAAEACVILAFDYGTMLACVRGQRPELLADPTLANLAAQIDDLHRAFEARVHALATPKG